MQDRVRILHFGESSLLLIATKGWVEAMYGYSLRMRALILRRALCRQC